MLKPSVRKTSIQFNNPINFIGLKVVWREIRKFIIFKRLKKTIVTIKIA